MTTEIPGTIRVSRTVAFGDCDPAGIAYTRRLFDYCLEAIDEAWKYVLDGKGWYELSTDHDRGTPFVNITMDFTGPVTPRDTLDLIVRLSRVGQSSITFEVSARQAGRDCFKGIFTSVVVERQIMTKVRSDDWTLHQLKAWAKV